VLVSSGVNQSSARVGKPESDATRIGSLEAADADVADAMGNAHWGAAGSPASPRWDAVPRKPQARGSAARRAGVTDANQLSFLESSLVPLCTQDSTPKVHEIPLGIYSADEPTIATRTDGGYVSDFIYATPMHRVTPPPPESRKGYSDALSSKGARAIQAAAQIALERGTPFQAMWVFSVTDEYLPAFLPPDGYDGSGTPRLTMSGELRRFNSHLLLYCQRNGLHRPEYAWVGESKSDGERLYHPHPHYLTTLAVRRSEFEVFSSDIERLWGLGSVHMTVLRNRHHASKYLLKGVGYSVKGTDGSQGRVWGRRWGISKALKHREERIIHPDSVVASGAVVEVANYLRALGLDHVQTPYGTFTVRGFYPEDGITWRQVTMARSIAVATLDEVSSEG